MQQRVCIVHPQRACLSGCVQRLLLRMVLSLSLVSVGHEAAVDEMHETLKVSMVSRSMAQLH